MLTPNMLLNIKEHNKGQSCGSRPILQRKWYQNVCCLNMIKGVEALNGNPLFGKGPVIKPLLKDDV